MAKIYDGATYLRAHLGANDYYSAGETVIGRWLGKGAKMLGIVETLIPPGDAAFERLRKNRHPATNEKLTERTSSGRVAFLDIQCSAPKSVSLLAVTFGDTRLRTAHEVAAKEAFLFVERFAARRIRKGAAAWSDQTRYTGNLCAAAFLHDASRELDAQLHTHFVTANATFDPEEERWAALTESEILKAIRCCGKFYQATLARAVKRAGYEITSIRDDRGNITGFEIVGVTVDDRATASRRRASIDASIREFEASRGRRPTKKEVDRIVRDTRAPKLAEITTEEVRRRQLEAFTPERREALRRLVNQAQEQRSDPTALPVEPTLAAARDHVFERHSVVLAHEVVAEALNQHLGDVNPMEVVEAVLSGTADLCVLARDVIPEAGPISSRVGLEAELGVIQAVNPDSAIGGASFRPR